MKLGLEKALTKAKKQRDEKSAKIKDIFPQEQENVSALDSGAWQTPVYSETRRCELDLEKVKLNHCICILDEIPEAEHYKVLRAQIQSIATEKSWRTFMITSAQPGDGKTITSINLAFSFAKAFNQTVLLVDADLRKQQIHHYLGIKSDMGLKDYLLDGKTIQECLIWPGVEKLILISGGKGIRSSSELMGSPMMKSFVQEVRDRYEDRFVFFDVPPVFAGADALEFASLVDGIIMVVDAKNSSKKSVKKAIELLPKEKMCGIVFNRYHAPITNYYKYYKYY